MSSVYGPAPCPPAASYGVASEPAVSKEPEVSRGVNKINIVAAVIFSAIAVASLIGVAFVANPLIGIALFVVGITAATIALALIFAEAVLSSSSTTYVSDTHHTDVVVVGSPPVRSSPSVVVVDDRRSYPSHTSYAMYPLHTPPSVVVDPSRRSPPPSYVSGVAARPSHSVSSRLPSSDGMRMGNPLRGSAPVPSRGHGGHVVVDQRR